MMRLSKNSEACTAEVKYDDPNMLHEAVLAYREQFNLTPNRGYRRDIAVTIQTYDDLLLWQNVIARWGYLKGEKWVKRNPLDIKGMLTVFEMRVREKKQQDENSKSRSKSAEHSGESGAKGLSKRSTSVVPIVLKRENGWAG